MRLKSFLLVLLCCCILLSSCAKEVRAEHCELGIILPSGFEKYDTGGAFDLGYSNGSLIVGISRISFSAGAKDDIPPTLEPRGFAELYMSRAGHEGEIYFYGDVPYYTYTQWGTNKEFTYAVTFYRSPYAYFFITFITETVGGVSLEDMLSLTGNVYLDLD